ncbi:thioredoxin domain-containing protein [Geotalea toluenoxydans]|uniref:thioredoxin domain-containing protein n=1 Tax=Geotalea toluenoxydans TaxID=421624 RepID=UPI0006CF76A8|nr:thioredoxin domain-containing protein [Geotalea toluenoxydans]
MAAHGGFHDENENLHRLASLDKSRIPADGGADFNRLIFAHSPYLLQHAENPVDWFQWGEEAFAKARAEDKPIFLSIGYATCHWCHVMAHESFEDREVAKTLNDSFVAIKVDREERPDIDDQFMAVAQMISGSGGWPLNVLLTPDKKPFFAATYLPKERRMGMPGIIDLLARISQFWQRERDKVEESCRTIMASLERLSWTEPAYAGGELEEAAFNQLAAMYDGDWGGFGQAPKFPMPHYISFLLRCWKAGRPEALQMAEHTLTRMRQGGIYDQLGFGIHRYSVDRQWLVPHFEKMLYDQALVAIAFAEAFQATGKNYYREVVREILNYCLVEMTGIDGGFCSAQDADTEGQEGKFYLWAAAEVKEVLGEEAARLFCRLFDITEKGNFEGKNILHLPASIASFADREGLIAESFKGDLIKWRAKLLTVRQKRIRPLRDAKVLTAWNGLLIAALAKGYGVTGDETYLRAAESAVTIILEKLQTREGRLSRSYHLGQAKIPAFLEDYAFLGWGLLELYQVSLHQEYLFQALRLARDIIRLFSAPGGGFYDSGMDAEEVLIRQKNAYDGAMPSGNSIAAMNLLRLGKILKDDSLETAGEQGVGAFLGNALQQPAGYLQLIMAHDYQHAEKIEITLAGAREGAEIRALLAAINRHFIPGLVLRHAEDGDAGAGTMEAPAVGAAAYICASGACRPPVTTADELESLLVELE